MGNLNNNTLHQVEHPTTVNREDSTKTERAKTVESLFNTETVMSFLMDFTTQLRSCDLPDDAKDFYLELRTFDENKNGTLQPGRYWLPVNSSVKEIAAAVEWLRAENVAGKGCYFGANPRYGKSGKKEAVTHLCAVYVDADVYKTPSYTQADVLKTSEGLNTRPHFTVNSGQGVQLLWLHKAVETAKRYDEWLTVQQGHRVKFEDFDADEAVVKDQARVLRVPGAVHGKNPNRLLQTGVMDSCYLTVNPGTLTRLASNFVEIHADRLKARGAGLPPLPEVIEQGTAQGLGRNTLLFKHACKLRDQNYPVEAISGALRPVNDQMCDPPLEDAELESVIAQAMRYTPTRSLLAILDDDGIPNSTPLRVGNEFGIAYYDRLRWLATSDTGGTWYAFRDGVWRVDFGGKTFNESYGEMLTGWYQAAKDPKYTTAQQDAFAKRAARYDSREQDFIAKRVKAHLTAHVEDFDSHRHLLNVRNGVVDLQTGELMPHDGTLMLSKMTRVAYVETATCPRFEQFIDEITDNRPGLRAGLLRWLGYCLTGETREHKFATFSGTGRNGKSLLTSVIAYILGGYAGTMQSQVLVKRKADDNEWLRELAGLQGVRFVVAAEPPNGSRWNGGFLKEITGEGTVNSRAMHKDKVVYEQQFKLNVTVNNRPDLDEITDAMLARLMMWPFDVSFVGREDRTLETKLKGEAEGILALLVREAVAYYSEGMPECQEERETTKAYFEEQDTFGQFVKDCLIVTGRKADELSRGELRDAYNDWCGVTGNDPVDAKEFAGLVKKIKGVSERRLSSGRTWQGVKLNPDHAQR